MIANQKKMEDPYPQRGLQVSDGEQSIASSCLSCSFKYSHELWHFY